MDQVNPEKGYLVGTTNQLFLTLQRMRADITIDLDRDILILSEHIKPLLKHTAHEKKLFK